MDLPSSMPSCTWGRAAGGEAWWDIPTGAQAPCTMQALHLSPGCNAPPADGAAGHSCDKMRRRAPASTKEPAQVQAVAALASAPTKTGPLVAGAHAANQSMFYHSRLTGLTSAPVAPPPMDGPCDAGPTAAGRGERGKAPGLMQQVWQGGEGAATSAQRQGRWGCWLDGSPAEPALPACQPVHSSPPTAARPQQPVHSSQSKQGRTHWWPVACGA